MMATVLPTPSAKKLHPFQTDDPRLRPIHDKVMAQERLSADDALALYRSGDILAVGWLANHVRERMHGDTAYFNVNRHINYTNVCVAACRLCAFGRKKDVPGAYTMALEEVWTHGRLPATPRPSPSSTSSAACMPTCRSSTTSI